MNPAGATRARTPGRSWRGRTRSGVSSATMRSSALPRPRSPKSSGEVGSFTSRECSTRSGADSIRRSRRMRSWTSDVESVVSSDRSRGKQVRSWALMRPARCARSPWPPCVRTVWRKGGSWPRPASSWSTGARSIWSTPSSCSNTSGATWGSKSSSGCSPCWPPVDTGRSTSTWAGMSRGCVAPWAPARARSRLINVLVSTLRGAPTTEGLPYEMNAYDLRPLIVRLIDAGISQLWVEAWLDGEGTDAMLFFRRDTHR